MERLYLENMTPIKINPFSHMKDSFRITHFLDLVNSSMENQTLYVLKENGIVLARLNHRANFMMEQEIKFQILILI